MQVGRSRLRFSPSFAVTADRTRCDLGPWGFDPMERHSNLPLNAVQCAGWDVFLLCGVS
jgi:hypothetical protein